MSVNKPATYIYFIIATHKLAVLIYKHAPEAPANFATFFQALFFFITSQTFNEARFHIYMKSQD